MGLHYQKNVDFKIYAIIIYQVYAIKYIINNDSLCISLYKLANECSDMNVYLWQVNDKPRKVYFRSINRLVLKQKHHLRQKIPMGQNL